MEEAWWLVAEKHLELPHLLAGQKTPRRKQKHLGSAQNDLLPEAGLYPLTPPHKGSTTFQNSMSQLGIKYLST